MFTGLTAKVALLAMLALPALPQELPSGGYLTGKVEEAKNRSGEPILHIYFKNTGNKTVLVEWELIGSEAVQIPGGYTEVGPNVRSLRIFEERRYDLNGGQIGVFKIINMTEI